MGSEFIVRPFTPSMSLKTATALSADWHEAVANNLDGPNSAFPAPWHPAARLGDYEILPIEDAASLYREGTAMHHCVGTYGDQVQRGNLYIYSDPPRWRAHRNLGARPPYGAGLTSSKFAAPAIPSHRKRPSRP